jgi:hypothetical protein
VSDEFEDRRRALDAQYLAALELLREGYRLKLAELDQLRSARAEAAAPPAAIQPPSASPPPASAAPQPGQRPSPPAPRPSGPPPRPPRRDRKTAPEVELDLTLALPDLPETFDNKDIFRGLGYKPTRATLARGIAPVLERGYIVLEEKAHGRQSNIYRRTLSEASLELLRAEKATGETLAASGEADATTPRHSQT